MTGTMDNTTAPTPLEPGQSATFTLQQKVSHSALALVRADFNPSHSTDVGRLKQLCAALITEAEELRARPLLSESALGGADIVPNKRRNEALKLAQRNCSIAITHLEDACMHLVKAATA